MEFFDSHAHYDDAKFDDNRENLIMDIFNSGVTKIISAGYSLEGSKKSLELSSKYNFIYSTVGISPNDLVERDLEENITKVNENNGIQVENNRVEFINNNYPQLVGEKWIKDIEEIDKLISDNLSSKRIVAVGEIGLDYHYDTDKKIQYEAFGAQIDIANKYDLPIVIHTRDAVMDTLTMLKEKKVNRTGVFHCCPLNRELVKEGLKLGFYISFAGPITFKNSKNADEIIDMVPNDRMLIETDSPYLSPEPLRGRRNNPINVKYIAKKIAAVKGISEEEVARITYENVKKIYKID